MRKRKSSTVYNRLDEIESMIAEGYFIKDICKKIFTDQNVTERYFYQLLFYARAKKKKVSSIPTSSPASSEIITSPQGSLLKEEESDEDEDPPKHKLKTKSEINKLLAEVRSRTYDKYKKEY